MDTPGYAHLSEEEASDMVEQMLRLSTLMYEMLVEQEQETKKQPCLEHYPDGDTKANRKQPRQQHLR